MTVKDSDPEQVLRMRDELFKVVEAQLAALQAREGVSELHSIGLRYFSVGSEAEALAGARMRAVVLVGVLGGVLTLLVIFSVDKASRRPSSLLDCERDFATRSPGAVAPPEPVRTLRRSGGTWPPPPAGPGPHPLERGDPFAGGDFGVGGRAN